VRPSSKRFNSASREAEARSGRRAAARAGTRSAHGKNTTLWPGFTWRSQATAHFSIADYHAYRAPQHAAAGARPQRRRSASTSPSGLRQTRSTDMKHFDNKVAAITGAGSGMGRSLAVQLAGAGCHLALADKNAVGLAETERIVRALAPSVRVTTRVLDVGDRDAMFAWADETAPRTAA
jgi:hypothetical protein